MTFYITPYAEVYRTSRASYDELNLMSEYEYLGIQRVLLMGPTIYIHDKTTGRKGGIVVHQPYVWEKSFKHAQISAGGRLPRWKYPFA